MKQLITLIKVVFLLTLFYYSMAYCQVKDTTEYQEYIIKTSKINFHFKDSIYSYTLFIEPDGEFYFKTNFIEREPMYRYLLTKSKKPKKVTKGDAYKEIFKQRTDSIISIESLYPRLINHDSAFINEYPFDYETLPLIYELEYSFILNNLREPSLYSCENKRAIRIVIPAEGIETPGRYSSIRIEFENQKTILIYAEGDFNKEGNFQVLKNKTCILEEKGRTYIEAAIKKIDFKKEYYFTKANLDEKYLIEYRNGNEYYALRRPLYKKEYENLCATLLSLSLNRKCKE